ncbi:MAG: hypothetical protein ABJG47_15630 [Ekhidna sp.]
MIESAVDILLGVMTMYLIAGVLFSIYFYVKGASKIDEGTDGTPWHFKLIIFPGVVLLWPALFIKLL